MKNTVYVKKLKIEYLEWSFPKDLINVNGMDLVVYTQSNLELIEDNVYQLFLDVTNGEPNHEGYQQCLENEPIIDELNEYYEFLTNGTISEKDFDTLLENKVGVFETDVGSSCYQIVGQAKGEYLVTNNIYFYIGKNRGVKDGNFLVVYCEVPFLCQELSR